MKLSQDTNLANPLNLINLNYLLSTPIFPPYYCAPLASTNSENELNLALDGRTSNSLSQKMLQLNQDLPAEDNAAAAVQALTNALSMNQTSNSAIALATANALRLNNGLDALTKIASPSAVSPNHSFKQTNGSINLVNSSLPIGAESPDGSPHQSAEAKRIMLKKSNNERKYPCGFPGCNWIFTRSNHVVRHQRRIHGLKVEMKPEHGQRRSSGSQVSSHHRSALGYKSASAGHLLNRAQLAQPNLQLMLNRKLLHLKDEFPTRLTSLPIKRTFSKNSLLNSSLLCNGNSGGLQLARPKQHRPAQQQLKISNIRRFQCDVDDCGQKFSSELMFNNHLKLVHNVNRNLINKHSVNLNTGGTLSAGQSPANQQNTSLNNLNSIRNNTVQNPGSQIINLLASQQQQQQQQQQPGQPAKSTKTNMNAINNHIKLFLSNKTVNQVEGQDSFASYINNLNANLKLKLLQFRGNNTSVTVNNLVTSNGNAAVVQQPPQLNITKVAGTNTINLPKVILPVTTLSALNTLNLPTTTIASQPNKPLFITQIQLPSGGGGQLITDKLLTNATVIQQPAAKGHVIYQCEIKSCIKRFNTKDNLVDHLFDEHNAFEPEVVVKLDSSDENWMLLEDPKRVLSEELADVGQPLAKSSDSNEQDYRPCRIARSSNEPSLATTLGIVKDVITRVDNVNMLNNIAATSSTTYSGLNKTHVCNINNCTKSFSKRYHLVRHRLEAHQVGKLSLMQDILNEKNGQELKLELLRNVNTSTTDRLPPAKIKKKENSPIPKLVIKNISTTPVASSSLTTPFYMRRPPADYRPYPCRYPKCGWSFKRAYHLKRHCRTHNHYFADCPEEPPKGWKMPLEDEEEEDEDEGLETFEDDRVIAISPEPSENDEEKDDEPALQIAEEEEEEEEMIVELDEKEPNEELKEGEESKCEESKSEADQIEAENEPEIEEVQIEEPEKGDGVENEPVIEKAIEAEKKVEHEVEQEPEKVKLEEHKIEHEIEAVQEVKEEPKPVVNDKEEEPTKEAAKEPGKEPAKEPTKELTKESSKASCKLVQPIVVRKVTRSASIELQQKQLLNKKEVEQEKPASKAESKPESKSDTKSESKSENKAESKPENKPDSKPAEVKTESKAPESLRSSPRKAPDTRRSTRQGIKQEPVVTDEDQSSCEVAAADPQLLRCEFSQCKLTFRRKRQYDLHIKTHLAEKSSKRPRQENDEPRLPNHRTSSNNLIESKTDPNENSSNDENSSEERYAIAEQSAASSVRTYRTSRTRRGCHDLNNNNLSLELDGKPESPAQLLLLCNAKDMIIYQNEPKTRSKVERNLFVCDEANCRKKFGRNCELTRHKLNHQTNFWPYICSYSNCGKKFKRKDVYKNHHRTHEKNGDRIGA